MSGLDRTSFENLTDGHVARLYQHRMFWETSGRNLGNIKTVKICIRTVNLDFARLCGKSSSRRLPLDLFRLEALTTRQLYKANYTGQIGFIHLDPYLCP
ncbi:hypothetical protein RRG08_014844 [Elysia crispata]|uniref:Uncharacterized protein n=1 Tax=Elysia crispata TaxID=231223 RepID=A0AAE0Z6A9_9GAST|nr:hypothetical protein RRG08_014844 [Elysia crispata]